MAVGSGVVVGVLVGIWVMVLAGVGEVNMLLMVCGTILHPNKPTTTKRIAKIETVFLEFDIIPPCSILICD
ncbi:MAG: hypothetical protein C0410_07180 [Anaerolinea sp.]|nr:hypothetical protein [Anaerolinea sp.]